MLILRPYEPQLLLPMPDREWRTPSAAQAKDQFGNENRTRFRLTARLDGKVQWRGWFDSRDDADAFLFGILRFQLLSEPMPRGLWDLPTPHWHPAIAPFAEYDLATTITLTSPTGSNQTGTSPSDWNNLSNEVNTIGAGGTGGQSTAFHMTGGGGGASNRITNFSFATPGTTTYVYRIAALTAGTTGAASTGADSWFNGTTLAGSSVGSKGGSGGANGSGSRNGGAGGVAASGIGGGNNGGRGGNMTGSSGDGASGGGGAGGPNGAGTAGTDSSSTGSNIVTAGGSGDNGSGGSGSAGVSGGSTSSGSAGQEWGTNVGSGGASGGCVWSSPSSPGSGGNYGAGSGGRNGGAFPAGASGNGAQGLIVLIYTPASTVFVVNLAMMGM